MTHKAPQGFFSWYLKAPPCVEDPHTEGRNPAAEDAYV